jgi:hypothetical protein
MKRTAIVLIGSLALLLLAGSGVAAAANNTSVDYYSNSSTSVGNASWTDGRTNATLDNALHYVSRVGTFVVGGGSVSSTASSVATGFLLFLVIAGASIRARLGIVGGSVISIVAVGGLSIAGFAPAWLYSIALFAVGSLGATLLLRAYR